MSFSSLLTFSSGGLSGGVYTDPTTNTVFKNYNGTSVNSFTVNSGVLTQSAWGTGTGIEIDIPVADNVYAIAFTIAGCNSNCTSLVYGSATVGLGTQGSHLSSYDLSLPGGGPAQFFGIVSDAPITSIFIASTYNNAYLGLTSFELGTESDSATPEAATFFSLGGGLIGLSCFGRFRRASRDSART